MSLVPSLTSSLTAPRANTQKDVNTTVWSELSKKFGRSSRFTILDNPCGQGEWLQFVQSQNPNAEAIGVDLFGPEQISERIPCYKLDSSGDWATNCATPESVDIVTCISGVMAFDNLTRYFKQSHSILKSSGLLVVTNDNTWTLRDRISYLFNGRVRRFRLSYNTNEGNWNNVSIAVLVQMLEKSGFEITEIKYTAFYPEDFALLPLALLLWPWQWLYRQIEGTNRQPAFRQRLYPFSALLARHYVIFAKKSTSSL